MSNQKIEIIVPEENEGERCDVFLTGSIEEDFSRSYIQRLIKQGHALIDETPAKANSRLKTGQLITLIIPAPEKLALEPRDIPLPVIYEDKDIAVINKPAGLISHPGAGNSDHTLVNALLFHLDSLSSIGGVERPGIVHRLDRDTAGLMVVAKSDAAHHRLVEMFAEREIKKRYMTIRLRAAARTARLYRPAHCPASGLSSQNDDSPDGRQALTEFTVHKIWQNRDGIFTWLDIDLHTGRTHQIRVHLSSLGLPIVGDRYYSKKWARYNVPYLLLASVSLAFTHPVSGKELAFSIDVPEHMAAYIKKMETLCELDAPRSS
jgi:23S rRNA pseudouridine1911/1915/1917 synthase